MPRSRPDRAVVGTAAAELQNADLYWRAANYLAAGQLYLVDNPLLGRPLTIDDVKPRLLGHWGTSPGLNFIYTHVSLSIRRRDLNVLFICGPGHGAPAMLANSWLEGTYSERYSLVSRDAAGLQRLFRQFSFPGGVPSHCSPETPGSIHEGGELGYSLSHAFGAVFDNPDLIAACVVGDGEAETGPAATGWHSNKFLDPRRDGAVLPILHLNGYKIAAPTVLGRIPTSELLSLFTGYGYNPVIVEGGFDGEEMISVHGRMAAAVDWAVTAIQKIQQLARDGTSAGPQPGWPLIILRTPKGWTGPKLVDGVPVEGTFRAHQIPLSEIRTNPEHLAQLEAWLRSYRPDELFDANGSPVDAIRDFTPAGDRRMSANPAANGGVLSMDLDIPDFRSFSVDVASPGSVKHEATKVLGSLLREILKDNPSTFRLFGPDETASNRLQAVFEVTNRTWDAEIRQSDDHLAPDGRVMEVLSEHQCQGWLEGYLLTGRHGLFNCYEAFVHIVDSMFNQHAKWLKVSAQVPWRHSIPSLNYLLSSHVWRQDNNGFSHQDPGFIDHVVNKKASVVRVYFPPDTNCLLSVADHCLRSRDYVNVIVAGKQPQHDWLTVDGAIDHCARGLGIWTFASNEGDEAPDVVMACCGDVPTLETLAAVDLLRKGSPHLKVRVVNVVDLMRLESNTQHPHGLTDREFDNIFTTDRPVIFAFHGYPMLIHRLTYKRQNHDNFHVHGYQEEGTTTTPFDMVMLNDLDRFSLAIDALDRTQASRSGHGEFRQQMDDARLEARRYGREHGEDLPEISEWRWGLEAPQ